MLKVAPEIRVSVLAEFGAYRLERGNLKVLPCFNRKVDYPSELLKVLGTFSPDVVHIQHEFAIFNPDHRFFKLLLGLSEKTQIVVTLHTVHTTETSDWKGMEMSMEEYNRTIGRFADAIVVHHDSMKRSLVQQGVNDNKINMIRHGTELLERFDRGEARRRLGLPLEGKLILSFGFFGRYKNKDFIIEALPRVLEEVPDAFLFFSGYPREGLLEDFECLKVYKRKARELGVKDRVIFASRPIPDEELPLVFSSCDVAVYPYIQRYLSASGSLHLALGAFKPVTVSDIPKFEEVKEEISKELVFDPTDHEELVEIIVKLLTNTQFEKRVIGRVKNHARNTSWEVSARKHLGIYKSLWKE